MFNRDRLRNVLQTLGGIALFIALMPSYSMTMGATANQAMAEHLKQNTQDMPYKQEFSFGLPDSHLFYHYKVKTLEPDGDKFTVNTTTIMKIGWQSWSAFSLVLSVVFLGIASRVKPTVPIDSPTSEPSIPPQ